jgi:hypothetical protein
MKRISLGLAAVAVLASLASCSSDSSSSDAAQKTSASATASEAPSESPSEADAPTDAPTDVAVTGDPERFATAYAEVAALFTQLNAQDDGSQPDPTSTEEANSAAGLDDTTALVFADYTPLPDGSGGSYCLLSAATGTYVATSVGGASGEVDLGDGECSYDTAAAVVVGDLDADTWSVGGDLMGGLVPSGVFGG